MPCTIIPIVLALGCRSDTGLPESQDPLAHADEIREPVVGEPSVALLDLAYAGCSEVWLEPQPRCLVEAGKPIRLWITQPDGTKVTVHVDGVIRPAAEYRVEGMNGFGLEVELPPNAEELVVELAKPRSRWSLPLGTWSEGIEPPPGIHSSIEVDDALGDAFLANEDGRHTEALKLLAKVDDLATRYPKGQADLATYLGLVYLGQGRYHDAATALREGVTFAMRLHDRELINDSIHVYAGVLAELGYWDAAIDWSDQVLKLARVKPELFDCVSLARIMITVGYAHLLFARQQGEPAVHARSLLEQGLARVRPTGECPHPDSVPAALLSLADEALDRGEPEAALATLATLATIDIDDAPTADQRLRLRDAKLRALDRAGRPWPDLEQALVQLEQEVADTELAEGRWRLELRRGDLLVQQGRSADAVAAYRRAEHEAHRIAEQAAVGVGRETAVALHGESTERLVGLLATLGRHDEALCAAREAQARRIQAVGSTVVTVEQRDALDREIERYQATKRKLDEAAVRERLLPRRDRDMLRLQLANHERQLATLANDIVRAQSTWRPSCDDLVPRGAGELLLGLYPVQRGWFVFVEDAAGTDVHSLDGGPKHALDDPALGTELLDPLTERLTVAKRVRVLASGRAQTVDVHLLTWNGRRLVEHVPVAYGAELPQLQPASSPMLEPIALLVSDPTETLPMAPTEVLVAAGWMATQGWTPSVPTPDEADRTRILDGLAHASFFYFAGHGEHDVGDARALALPPYAGGTRDWPARLHLKPPTMLEVQDILTLPLAPKHVALLGCETGVPGGTGGGMSLALAFLVAGAEEVVATPVEAENAIAFETGLGLLRGISTSGVDLAEGLQRSQALMLREGRPVGRYRVWVR